MNRDNRDGSYNNVKPVEDDDRQTRVTPRKPLACSSPLRITKGGVETRYHRGFGLSIPESTYPENQPYGKRK